MQGHGPKLIAISKPLNKNCKPETVNRCPKYKNKKITARDLPSPDTLGNRLLILHFAFCIFNSAPRPDCAIVRHMKIALSQLNPVIGAFTANVAKIAEQTEKAKNQGCNLIVFPEMAISGYPPQDLLERGSFLVDQESACAALIEQVRGIGVLCGVITRHTAGTGKFLHNSAILFEDGKLLFATHKRLLPTYDVFDESRYFEPGAASRAFTYKGLVLGITICEDIWNDKEFFRHRLYAVDPVNDLLSDAAGKIDLFINLAASPFNLGKILIKQEIFQHQCLKHQTPLLYANQVGGQDSLLFDGMSLAMNRQGRIVALARRFAEDLLIIDTEALDTNPPILLPDETTDETAILYEALVMGVRDYVTKCGFSKAVLGLSGGIDSALTAAIASAALGRQNVLGIALPSPYTTQASIDDAKSLADNLGIHFDTLPITELFEAELQTLAKLFSGTKPGITEQNIQARIRGNLLMAISNKFGYMLLSTGNKSEMAVGYCTLYGDMSGGLAVISDVPKCLVYKLALYLNREQEIIPCRTITRAPTAELAANQKDQDDLPPYEVLDPILTAYLEENRSIKEIVAKGFDLAIVKDVIRRITSNEYKRKQAPMGLKVTSKAFGYGRRYPTTERYTETT